MIDTKYANTKQSVLYGFLIGLGLALVFTAGFLFRDFVQIAAVNAQTPGAGYPLLDEVQILLDQNYLREQPDYTQRQYAAIRGLLSALDDRYTFFIDPPVAQSESDVLAGTYGGIGVLLQRNEAGDFVLFPFPDSPAIRAGIVDGDRLVAVNGTRLTLAEQQDAVDQLLRGEVREGNGVEITVGRHATGEEFTVFITFDVINVPSVVWRVLEEDARIGYIQILRFTNRTPDELAAAVTDLRAAPIQALVLDLRNNAGGLLQESVDIADAFLDGGVVLYQRSRDSERTFDAQPGGIMTDLPLIVLVNGGTASASELVAGAIRDSGRGILIGQTTYGKGTVQEIFRLSDQSSVHITSAEWFTPNNSTIEGTGLTPDIAMIPDINGRDVELGEAVRQLQQQLGQSS
ncbi:MAG: S41 family peptidase [Chloroflexi bacterium]|nr:S41 family peptidase [Chloroflexota bacterium]